MTTTRISTTATTVSTTGANLDLDVTSTTTLTFNVSGIVSNDNKPLTSQGASGMIRNYYQATPFYSPGIIDGRMIYAALDYTDLTLPFVGASNPLEYLQKGSYGTNLNKLQSDLQLSQKLDFVTPGLSFRLKGSYNSWFNSSKEVTVSRALLSCNSGRWFTSLSPAFAESKPSYAKRTRVVATGTSKPLSTTTVVSV